MRQTNKYCILFVIGGILYSIIELVTRGYTHWAMFLLGGLCFICLGLINELLPWKTPFIIQMLIGGVVITTLELLAGYVVNIKLGWAVWDYSMLSFNFKGQICLWFSLLWCLLSSVGIVLDDWFRYWWFGEEKPRYKIF